MLRLVRRPTKQSRKRSPRKPLHRRGVSGRTESARSQPGRPPKPLRIFLVEDHTDTRKWLGVWLEDIGHAVVSVATLAQAVKEFPRSHCNVLLCDIGLPDGTGWDLLPKLQLKQPVCAIAMSGFGREDDRAKSNAAGYRYHVLKPLDPDELEPILQKIAREEGA